MQSSHATTGLTAPLLIGKLLKEQRKKRHLTGEQLAQKTGVSQSKISKIENGYSSSLDANQVEAIVEILKIPKIIRQQISMLLFQCAGGTIDQISYPFTDFPEVLNDLQKTSTNFRCYIICGISAVLQTSEYRVAYLKRLGASDEDAQKELGRTIGRQDALWDVNKTFHLIMPEAALYTMPADPQTQIAQMDRLERLIGLKNIHIGIVPMQAGTSVFETGSFTFYDDQILYVTIGDRVMQVKDPESLLNYTNAVNELSQMASFDVEAIPFIRKAADYFAGICA